MSTESSATAATCCGCLMNPWWYNNYYGPPPFPYDNWYRPTPAFQLPPLKMPTFNSTPTIPQGLVDKEKEVCFHLAKAWEAFAGLQESLDDDIEEFRKAIHDAQKTMALRVARRCDPEVWRQSDEKSAS